jgi:hypothetical protein
MATMYQKRMAARRSSSDIGRLAQQYQQEIAGVTGQYETEYSKYLQAVNEKMRPFEEEMAKYQSTVMPTYESQLAEYRKKLKQHNEELADIEKNPVIEKIGKKLAGSDLIANLSIEGIPEVEYTYYEPREIPKFTGKAPTLPTAPVAPEIEKFDEGEFGTKRAAAESTFKREVGERKAARLGAVSRKMSRPLLSKERPQ